MKILLAFSGGVDSCAAAVLLRQQGHELCAVNMILHDDCDTERVRCAAEKLGIEVHFLDLKQDFQDRVMRPCWDIFASGCTPNPCAICNPAFKFGVMLEYAKKSGCDALATGHYAQIENGILKRGCDRAKDQSYFLFGLTREQLDFIRFPLGKMCKDEVRKIVAPYDLPPAKESQDICFGGDNVQEFLRNKFNAPVAPGCFIHNETGKILGKHAGIHAYTIGQRKGLRVALGVPAYVRRIDSAHNAVYLTDNEQTLFSGSLTAKRMNWQIPPEKNEFNALVQVRYRGAPSPATVQIVSGNTCIIRFESPVRAITPGQCAVIYDEDSVLGGGFIQQQTT